MPTPPKKSTTNKPKERADVVRKELQEAYERGATSEATRLLIEEFDKRRKAYIEDLKALRKQAGL